MAMAAAAAAADKAQDKSKEKHKRFRSDRYSKMLERQRLLRECETVSALAKAEAILKAEKEYLMKHGVRVNWPGKKALEEAYKQTQQQDGNSSLPLSTSSTSISYSSNIHVDPKLPASYGGSLPASPRHTPLQKAPHFEPPPMGRISLASASPIRGNPLPSDNSFNFSFNENSAIFSQPQKPPELTSTPVGTSKQPQQPISFSFQATSASTIPVTSEPKAAPSITSSKLLFGSAPSASNSTDSGKFSSDNATGRLDAELAKTPQSEKPLFAGFSSAQPLFSSKPATNQPFFSSTTTVTQPFFSSTSTVAQPLFSSTPTGNQSLFSSTPGMAATTNQSLFSSTSTVAQPLFSSTPTGNQSIFSSTPTTNQPIFSSTTTITSLPASTMSSSFIPPPPQPFQKSSPQSDSSSKSTSVHKLPTRLTPSAPITAVFKPPKVTEEPEPSKPHPVAVRWLRLQREYYRRFAANVKEFSENPQNSDIRRLIKMEVGNKIDISLQKRPSEAEVNSSLAELSQHFTRLLSGQTMQSTLIPNKTFTFDPKNDGMMNFLIDVCSRRIIEMVKQDPSLMEVAKLVHSVICLKIPTFKKVFRQILTNSMFLIQLTSDDLIITLDEKLTADTGYFTLNCLDTDKALLRFLCALEMVDSLQVKNLSDLCGIRLLYELCVACNTLPQLPVTTLSVLFEVMQTAGPALTAETSPYRKEFIQIVFPRLKALVIEDMNAAIDGVAVRLADPEFSKHLQKLHAIVRQRVQDALEKIGIKS